MSDYKQIKTRIWQDKWFLSLTPEEKLMWLFLLTNQYVHFSGLYELPKPLISPLTGSSNPLIVLKKFVEDGKIKMYEDWILITNFKKHQPISENVKDKVNIAICNYLKENQEVFNKINKPLISPLQAPPIKLKEKVKVKLKEKVNIADKISAPINEVNLLLGEFQKINPLINFGNKTERLSCENLLKYKQFNEIKSILEFYKENKEKEFCPQISSPYELEYKWTKLEAFYKSLNK